VLLGIFKSLANLRTPVVATSLLAFVGLTCGLALAAQQAGPMPPVPPREDTPASHPQPVRAKAAVSEQSSSPILKEPPAIPVAQIIQRFAQHETEFKAERANFTYSQSFVVQTVDSSGRPDGEYRMDSDITFMPSGKRYENITYAPPPTLQRISLSEQDLDDLRNIQPFVLTTADLPKYEVTYVGRQHIDQLGTYVFDVAPKEIEKHQRYFQGRIWVDDKDLEIVKTYGKAVPDIHKGSNENLFPTFETYRQNIDGPFWFPTYTHADDVLHFQSADVHVRMTVRYEDYKRFRSTVRILAPIGPAPPEHPETPSPDTRIGAPDSR
jgi:hypothetical protein